MQFHRHALDFYLLCPQLEKTLRKEATDHLHSEKFFRGVRFPTGNEPIPSMNGAQFIVGGKMWKFVEVESAVNCVQSENACAWSANHFVAHAIDPERHVSLGDALQWSVAKPPVRRAENARSEEAERVFLRDVGFQGLYGV